MQIIVDDNRWQELVRHITELRNNRAALSTYGILLKSAEIVTAAQSVTESARVFHEDTGEIEPYIQPPT